MEELMKIKINKIKAFPPGEPVPRWRENGEEGNNEKQRTNCFRNVAVISSC